MDDEAFCWPMVCVCFSLHASSPIPILLTNLAAHMADARSPVYIVYCYSWQRWSPIHKRKTLSATGRNIINARACWVIWNQDNKEGKGGDKSGKDKTLSSFSPSSKLGLIIISGLEFLHFDLLDEFIIFSLPGCFFVYFYTTSTFARQRKFFHAETGSWQKARKVGTSWFSIVKAGL